MRKLLFIAAASLAASVFGFTPTAYTNSYTEGGVTYVQRGALGTKDYVVTNVTMPTIVYPVTSVNSKTGAVVLVASDVQAIGTDTVYKVDTGWGLKVDGHDLPFINWNGNGDMWWRGKLDWNSVGYPSAADVGAVPADEGTTAAGFPFKLKENSQRTSTGITVGWETVDYYDSYGDSISFSPIGFKSVCDGLITFQKNWRDLAFVSNFDNQPTYQSNNGVKSGGVYSWADGRYLKSTDASTTYLRQDTASTTYETKVDATSKLNTATAQTTAVSNMVTTLSSQARMKDDFSIVTTKDDWNVNQVVAQYSSYTDFFIFKVVVFDDSTPYGMMVQAKNHQGGTWFPISDSEETWDTPEAVRAATQFTCGYVYDQRFSFINGKKIDKYYVVDGGRIANTNDINVALQSYVPTSRKINGQSLAQDITIEGMTDNAVVWTNSTLKTKAGATVNTMDYPAMTNTVNAVKAQYWDAPLAVNWTIGISNGDMTFSATTNVNQSVLN